MQFAILLTLLTWQTPPRQSFASEKLETLFVEVTVERWEVTEPRRTALSFKVDDVGLGADSLRGESLTASFENGPGSTLPVYQADKSDSFKMGETLVLAIQALGDNRRLWIVDVWQGKTHRSLEQGKRMIKVLRELNEAKDLSKLEGLVFDALESDGVDANFVYFRLCDGRALRSRETLFRRIADSKVIDIRWKGFAAARLKSDKPNWYFSDERRDELAMLVETTTEPEALFLAARDFAKAIASIKPKVGALWAEHLRKIAMEAEERPIGEALIIVKGVKAAMNPNYEPGTADRGPLVLWSCLIQIADASKNEVVRNAWQDAMLDLTQQGTKYLKEETLARLDLVQDKAFRRRLCDAANAPATKVGDGPRGSK